MSAPPDTLHRALARLLETGTWLASLVIVTGVFLLPRTAVINMGIAMLIALPILRVLMMLGAFARRRDRWGVAIAALVLVIIGGGIALGAAS